LADRDRLLLDLFLLCLDLLLLLLNCVYENGCHLLVLHTLDLVVFISSNQKRLDSINIFCAKPKIPCAAIIPKKANWPKP
jgi:hypothetical protein